MKTISLEQLPSQSVEFTPDTESGVLWRVRLYELKDGIMNADVYQNNVLLISTRVVPGTPILCYKFLTENGNLYPIVPDIDTEWTWQGFGDTCKLVWKSNDE